MSIATPATAIESTPAASLAVVACEGIARLLDGLNHHATGDDIAVLLSRTATLLQSEGVDIQRDADGISVNGQHLETGMLASLYRAMSEHDLSRVRVAAETPPRALLQFVALLAGPQGEQGVSFDQLWNEHGVWHVRVEFGAASKGAAGTDGDPTELFTQLCLATSGVERRRYFDALVALNAGAPYLINALLHPTWYVVRNAAALLGAMRVEAAEHALLRTITHTDTRVRVAATRALGALGTSVALDGLRSAINDRAPDVRRAAWRAMRRLERDINEPCPYLADALLQERDIAVLRELVLIVRTSPDCASAQSIHRAAARLTDRGDVPALACDVAEVLALRAPRLAAPILRRLAESSDMDIRHRVRAIEERLHEAPTPPHVAAI
ncbi:MAG: HEAT repeat domain-containing protein [Gemmatimonadaceae bacterium]|nr:HEAT repeat domain-containing protein [Gemmatimonadaceae bacterium]